jgi:cation diffusion facilitator family transporter
MRRRWPQQGNAVSSETARPDCGTGTRKFHLHDDADRPPAAWAYFDTARIFPPECELEIPILADLASLNAFQERKSSVSGWATGAREPEAQSSRGDESSVPESGRAIVYAALVGNVLVAATKAIAAFITGSSAMFSEAVHSLVDTSNELLLLYGLRRSHLPPDREHPLGYGRELYFWSFVVALVVFVVGAGVSILQGILELMDPEPLRNVEIGYIVLGLSFCIEGASWIVSFRSFRRSKGRRTYWGAIHGSKDPPQFIILLEDSAALCGILIALAGTWAAVRFSEPLFDGLASIAIGLLLAGVAAVLARESKGLLIGERADRGIRNALFAIANASPGVVCANGLITVQYAPDQVVVALSLQFEKHLTTRQIEDIVVEMEDRLRLAHPQILILFVKPEATENYVRSLRVPGFLSPASFDGPCQAATESVERNSGVAAGNAPANRKDDPQRRGSSSGV